MSGLEETPSVDRTRSLGSPVPSSLTVVGQDGNVGKRLPRQRGIVQLSGQSLGEQARLLK